MRGPLPGQRLPHSCQDVVQDAQHAQIVSVSSCLVGVDLISMILFSFSSFFSLRGASHANLQFHFLAPATFPQRHHPLPIPINTFVEKTFSEEFSFPFHFSQSWERPTGQQGGFPVSWKGPRDILLHFRRDSGISCYMSGIRVSLQQTARDILVCF